MDGHASSSGSAEPQRRRRQTMNGHPIIHFEFGCHDGERMRAFLAGLFDWEITGRETGFTIVPAPAGADLSGHRGTRTRVGALRHALRARPAPGGLSRARRGPRRSTARRTRGSPGRRSLRLDRRPRGQRHRPLAGRGRLSAAFAAMDSHADPQRCRSVAAALDSHAMRHAAGATRSAGMMAACPPREQKP